MATKPNKPSKKRTKPPHKAPDYTQDAAKIEPKARNNLVREPRLKTKYYIRFPINEEVEKLIARVQAEYPYFDAVDVLKYILSEYNKLKQADEDGEEIKLNEAWQKMASASFLDGELDDGVDYSKIKGKPFGISDLHGE